MNFFIQCFSSDHIWPSIFFSRKIQNFTFSIEIEQQHDDVRKLLSRIQNSQQSCVFNWGNASPYFNLEKGARQGDPISAYLFILALEVLFVFIKSNENIKGIEILKHVFLSTAYANDSTFSLRDIPSVKEIIYSFNQFYRFSDSKDSIEKCEIAGIGTLKEVTEIVCSLKCVDLSNDTSKILRIHF